MGGACQPLLPPLLPCPLQRRLQSKLPFEPRGHLHCSTAQQARGWGGEGQGRACGTGRAQCCEAGLPPAALQCCMCGYTPRRGRCIPPPLTFHRAYLRHQRPDVLDWDVVCQALAPNQGVAIDDTVHPRLFQGGQGAGAPGHVESVSAGGAHTSRLMAHHASEHCVGHAHVGCRAGKTSTSAHPRHARCCRMLLARCIACCKLHAPFFSRWYERKHTAARTCSTRHSSRLPS